MEIGKLIYKKRNELGLTLEEVGQAVGVSKSTVKKWEDGYISNMRRDKIYELAKVLHMNPVSLITGEETPIVDIMYSRISELCELNNITFECLEEKTGVNIKKTIDGYKKERVSKESIYGLKNIADYFGVVSSYFTGYPDTLEAAKLLAGKEIIGECHRISNEFKNQRVVDLASNLDALNDEDRDYFLDIFEMIINKYYKLLEQIDK